MSTPSWGFFFKLPDCLTDFTSLSLSLALKAEQSSGRGGLAPSVSHNASCNSQPIAGRRVEGSLHVGLVRHTHRSVPAGKT